MSKKTRTTRPRVVTFRASEEEYEQLQHWARLSGLSLSDYLRSSKARPSLTVTTTAAGPTSVTWRIS
jgi:uncharacterized protein (DUF1778 family)